VVTGKMTVEEGAQRMEETTHAFARRQYTWFRRERDLRWLESSPGLMDLSEELIQRYLDESS
jgi:tRNA dimethylallyltransferase